jgi:hypothetical protein
MHQELVMIWMIAIFESMKYIHGMSLDGSGIYPCHIKQHRLHRESKDTLHFAKVHDNHQHSSQSKVVD